MKAIVLDSSAVVAMLEGEPEAGALREAFLRAESRWIPALAVVESGIVLTRRRGLLGRAALDTLLSRFSVRVHPMDELQVVGALEAYERFGKGRHPAALNLGDCCVFAAARSLRAPLLQKGDDFARTDLDLVQY